MRVNVLQIYQVNIRENIEKQFERNDMPNPAVPAREAGAPPSPIVDAPVPVAASFSPRYNMLAWFPRLCVVPYL